jgi:hypothetical protein
MFYIVFPSVFPIRISFNTDADPDPVFYVHMGSRWGSGSGSRIQDFNDKKLNKISAGKPFFYEKMAV